MLLLFDLVIPCVDRVVLCDHLMKLKKVEIRIKGKREIFGVLSQFDTFFNIIVLVIITTLVVRRFRYHLPSLLSSPDAR
jgi:hypothetical protein